MVSVMAMLEGTKVPTKSGHVNLVKCIPSLR